MAISKNAKRMASAHVTYRSGSGGVIGNRLSCTLWLDRLWRSRSKNSALTLVYQEQYCVKILGGKTQCLFRYLKTSRFVSEISINLASRFRDKWFANQKFNFRLVVIYLLSNWDWINWLGTPVIINPVRHVIMCLRLYNGGVALFGKAETSHGRGVAQW